MSDPTKEYWQFSATTCEAFSTSAGRPGDGGPWRQIFRHSEKTGRPIFSPAANITGFAYRRPSGRPLTSDRSLRWFPKMKFLASYNIASGKRFRKTGKALVRTEIRDGSNFNPHDQGRSRLLDFARVNCQQRRTKRPGIKRPALSHSLKLWA